MEQDIRIDDLENNDGIENRDGATNQYVQAAVTTPRVNRATSEVQELPS